MDRPAAFDAFFVQLLKLFSSDSTGGASTLASAAVDAGILADDILGIALRNRTHRAAVGAGAAADAGIANLVSHGKHLHKNLVSFYHKF